MRPVINNVLARSFFKNASMKQKLNIAAGMSEERVCIARVQTKQARINAFGVALRRARKVSHTPKPISGIATVSVMK